MTDVSQAGVRQDAKRILRNGAIGFAFWTVVSLLFVLPLLAHTPDKWATVVKAFLQWWLWGVFSLAIVRVDRTLPLRHGHAVRWLAEHLGVGSCFCVAYAVALAGLRVLFHLGPASQLHTAVLLAEVSRELFWSLLIYFMIVGASEVELYQRRYVEAGLRAERSERMASEARLHTLRSQLDPHFLFNALNGISAYVERDPKLARRMIEHLGELLRLSLRSQGSNVVSLKTEIDFAQQYLALQAMRFGDRLSVHVDVPSELDEALVPTLLLQPLIENAVRHGLGPLPQGGDLWVCARTLGKQLLLTVADNGTGVDEQELVRSTGLGLRLTRERLLATYGEEVSKMQTRRRENGGTEVCITLPLRRPKDLSLA